MSERSCFSFRMGRGVLDRVLGRGYREVVGFRWNGQDAKPEWAKSRIGQRVHQEKRCGEANVLSAAT